MCACEGKLVNMGVCVWGYTGEEGCLRVRVYFGEEGCVRVRVYFGEEGCVCVRVCW